MIHPNWFLLPEQIYKLYLRANVFRCRAHFQFACEFKRDVENHTFFPRTRVVNDVEDLNSSEGKAAITEQHWLSHCRTELIQTALRRQVQDFCFLLHFFFHTECSPKYYVLYVVFLSIIFLLSQLYTISKVRCFVLFLYCTVYTEFVHHV